MMFSRVRMGWGKLRRSWNWTGQGTQRIIRRASTDMFTRKVRSKKINNVGKLVTMDKEKAELLDNRMRAALPRRILECCCMRGWTWAGHVHYQPRKSNVSWAAVLTLPQLRIYAFSIFFGNWQKSSKLNQ